MISSIVGWFYIFNGTFYFPKRNKKAVKCKEFEFSFADFMVKKIWFSQLDRLSQRINNGIFKMEAKLIKFMKFQ